MLAITVAEHGERIWTHPMTVLLRWLAAGAIGSMLSQQETKLKVIEFLNLGQNAAPKAVVPNVESMARRGMWGCISFLLLVLSFAECALYRGQVVSVAALSVGIAAALIFGKIPALKHGAIPMALYSFLLGEWPALIYYALLITLETGMAETRGAHTASSSTCRKNSPWVDYKKLPNAMLKREFNNYRDIEVMRIKDKGGVISKGYYKLEYLMSSLSSVPRRVIELGG